MGTFSNKWIKRVHLLCVRRHVDPHPSLSLQVAAFEEGKVDNGRYCLYVS